MEESKINEFVQSYFKDPFGIEFNDKGIYVVKKEDDGTIAPVAKLEGIHKFVEFIKSVKEK